MSLYARMEGRMFFFARVSAFLVFFTLSALSALALEPQVDVILPFDGAIVRSSSILVLFQTPAQFAPSMRQGEFRLKGGHVVGGNEKDLHHLPVNLKEGKNVLTFADPKTEKVLTTLTLFYVPPQSMKKVPGAKSKEFAFHKQQFERRCIECHPMPDETETTDEKSMIAAAKVCTSCHPQVNGGSTIHEPTAKYDCFSCHKTNYKPARFSLRSSQAALCSDCHKNFFERLMGGQKFVHGPVATGVCDVCHNAHGGDGKALLQESAPDLCLRCHNDTVAQEVKDSLHAKVECTKCHSPHGSEFNELIRKALPNLCLGCHEDPTKKFDGHPIQGHPVSGPVDPSKPGRAFGCLSCHSVHGKADIAKMNIIEDQEGQRKFCQKCHY